MRTVIYRTLFKHDFKREYRGKYRHLLSENGEFERVRNMLANDMELPMRYHDHPLHHNWEGSRECHLKPDLLLVYTYIGDEILRLDRLGSHSEIFGL